MLLRTSMNHSRNAENDWCLCYGFELCSPHVYSAAWNRINETNEKENGQRKRARRWLRPRQWNIDAGTTTKSPYISEKFAEHLAIDFIFVYFDVSLTVGVSIIPRTTNHSTWKSRNQRQQQIETNKKVKRFYYFIVHSATDTKHTHNISNVEWWWSLLFAQRSP